jgi:hypothetical protein
LSWYQRERMLSLWLFIAAVGLWHHRERALSPSDPRFISSGAKRPS